MIYDLDGDIVIGPRRSRRDQARGSVRLLAPRAHLRAGQHPRRRGPRLHQRHLPQRGAARVTQAACTPAIACASATVNSRSRSTDMLRVAEQYAVTDTGRQRRANEDSLLARSPLFVVADGMGGAQAGEVASRIAVESFQHGPRGLLRAGARARRPCARSQLAHPRALAVERRAGRHGHHAHRRIRRRARGGDRARRRQSRLLPARRRAAAPDRRPLARRRAHAPGPADARGGRRAPAALGHHPRPRTRGNGGGRHALLPRPRRRRLPAVQRRPHDDAQRGGDRSPCCSPSHRCATPARR